MDSAVIMDFSGDLDRRDGPVDRRMVA